MLQVNISYFTGSDFNYLYGSSDGAHPACTLKLMFKFAKASTCNPCLHPLQGEVQVSRRETEQGVGRRQQVILPRFVKSIFFVTGPKMVSNEVMLTNNW